MSQRRLAPPTSARPLHAANPGGPAESDGSPGAGSGGQPFVRADSPWLGEHEDLLASAPRRQRVHAASPGGPAKSGPLGAGSGRQPVVRADLRVVGEPDQPQSSAPRRQRVHAASPGGPAESGPLGAGSGRQPVVRADPRVVGEPDQPQSSEAPPQRLHRSASTCSHGDPAPLPILDPRDAIVRSRGCGLHIRYHDLRHTVATLLLAQGVASRTIMETLGHSRIGMNDGHLRARGAGAAAWGRGEGGRDPLGRDGPRLTAHVTAWGRDMGIVPLAVELREWRLLVSSTKSSMLRHVRDRADGRRHRVQGGEQTRQVAAAADPHGSASPPPPARSPPSAGSCGRHATA